MRIAAVADPDPEIRERVRARVIAQGQRAKPARGDHDRPTGMLSVYEVSERVGLSHWSVRRAIAAGELRAFKLRGQVRVSAAALDEWLATSEVRPRRVEREVTPALRALPDRRRKARAGASVPGRGTFRPGHYERNDRNCRGGQAPLKVRWRHAGRQRARRFDCGKDARAFDARITSARQLGEPHLIDNTGTTVDAYAAEHWDRTWCGSARARRPSTPSRCAGSPRSWAALTCASCARQPCPLNRGHPKPRCG